MAPRGTLEVTLVGGKNLKNMDRVGDMDPYCIINYKDQEKKSNIAESQGSDPDWNETFLFTIAGSIDELRFKIMDEDDVGSDDDVGECTIPLDSLLDTGDEARIDAQPYDVMRKGEVYGELTVGLFFNPEPDYEDREEHDCE